MTQVLYSPFIGRLLAEDAGSRGGHQGGSSSYSSLGMCLHHGSYWLGAAECAADGASYKAVSQNNSWREQSSHYKLTIQTSQHDIIHINTASLSCHLSCHYQVSLQTVAAAVAAAAE